MIGNIGKLMAAGACALATGVGGAVETTSDASIVLTDPSASILWKTIAELPVPLSIDWPKGAASAHLTATVGTLSLLDVTLTDTTVTTYEANFALPKDESEEAVLDFTLAFRDASGTALADGSHTVRLGLVRGSCGSAFRCIPQGTACGKWKSVRKNAVTLVPDDTASLTLDGTPLDFGTAPGWAYLAGLPIGSHVLAKTDTASNVVTAPLRVNGGMVLIVK